MTEHTSKHNLKIGIGLNLTEGSFEGRTPRFRDLQTMAQTAEQVGIDSIWLADHLIYRFPGQDEAAPWEMFTMLSALAAVTNRITLGSIVACTSFRPPAITAKMADALDEVSDGRFVLGLGAGWHQPEYEAFGYPFDHLASRFEEALQIIIPLLREGHVDFHGKYYEVNNCVLRPRGPSQAGPQILIGSRRPRMLKLTAQYANIWNTAWHVETDVVKERYAEFREACAAVGRDPDEVELNVGTAVQLPGGTDEDLSKAIKGTPEEIASKLLKFAEVGARHLITILDPLTPESIEQFGKIAELVRQG